jgi:hypothetical protein
MNITIRGVDEGTFRVFKETFMTHRDTHEHENVFSYQIEVLS